MIRFPNPAIRPQQPGFGPDQRSAIQQSRLNFFTGVRPTDTPAVPPHPAVAAYLRLLQGRR